MNAKKDYKNCLHAMYSLRRFGIKMGLSTIRRILEELGNPQDHFGCIHVAGTNGKGSIASGIASILNAAGYRTGLYTSPHLVTFNERISINGRHISDAGVVAAYEAVKNVYHGSREPTFFEFATAMAFYDFDRKGVDWAVIETGMGGRLDATNIVKPVVSIISNLSLEHQDYLGNTLAQIAAEKGGIIKEGVPVVTGVKQPGALSILNDIADAKSAPVFRLGKDFKVRRKSGGTFSFFGIHNQWSDMKTSLMGRHQIDNAAISLAACELLSRTGAFISERDCRQGLSDLHWPGRLEIVSESPRIILDGAHNLVAARNLAAFLAQETNQRPITMVIGILDDKPYKAMLSALIPIAQKVIFTRPQIDRGLPPETLYTEARKYGKDITLLPDVHQAVQQAVSHAAPDDVICIAGSLYVIGEAKVCLSQLLPLNLCT
ncbi:MAG: folylpolyglutamate synthase/dihydrofolate synthase family protein [Desulfobacterales bacterium]|nr:folylpolyglutamate synthase/dihydrofolate synthase family protein [Desulfobacterales bacterium]MDX2513232.1 folylpolyglutamate synthase/dihydrofolate synthase family protein [Desulfobacterales bacterium]